MATELSILLLGEQSTRLSSLAERTRRLGFSVVRAKTPHDALALAGERGFRFRAALLDSELPVVDFGGAVSLLRRHPSADDVVVLAIGPRPESEEALDELRAARVARALWEPIGEAALRFELNRAMAGTRVPRPRAAERVAMGWPARVFTGGREKEASLYSLSATGAFVETRRPSMSGASLALELPLPGGTATVAGRVVYTNVPGNLQRSALPHGMAVRFTDGDAEAFALIRESVDATLSQFAL